MTKKKAMMAVAHVRHDWYGCDTGCCGHRVDVEAPADMPEDALPMTKPFGKTPGRRYREADMWHFDHPNQLKGEAFARHLVEDSIRGDAHVRALIEACGGYELGEIEIEED